ncbi:hypothetical protein SAMN05216174_104254 [Actinokineospora iranica]|uniref:MFS transporter n=1 Tax=Actinokineospora iranica TaxID=1271860 RepID=A0A1G6PFS7_9PSEU|nr:hypothetical protein SAMN05216174_104254 [Actinokineospora iranica]
MRTVLLGLSSSALAVAAHGMAGGGVPDAAVTLVLTALVAWAGTAVADRRGGPCAMATLLGVSQYSLHVLLTDVTAAHPEAPGAGGGLMLATHAVATVLSAALLTSASTALAMIAAAVSGLVQALVVALPPTPAVPRPAPIQTGRGHLLAVVFREVLCRRGPPLTS